jgi:hypothetical protein
MKYGVPGTGGIPWHARAEMDSLDFLNFVADFSSTQIITAYDELPLWSAMFGLLLQSSKFKVQSSKFKVQNRPTTTAKSLSPVTHLSVRRASDTTAEM